MNDFQPFQNGPTRVYTELGLTNFDVEVSNGSLWVSMNDHFRYVVGADSFRDQAQTRRRITVNSPIYEGTYEVHSVRENVEETLTVFVIGQSNGEVTENMLNLIYLFSQTQYNLRRRLNDHIETWRCMPADYTIDRSHVNAHNSRAHLTFTIPRLPDATHEVVL